MLRCVLAIFGFGLMSSGPIQANIVPQSLLEICNSQMSRMPGKFDEAKVKTLCNQVQVMDDCSSEKGIPIYHYDSMVNQGLAKGKKVLAISMIHGDELESGSVTRRWMERLSGISARNIWRVIPMANPDGWAEGKRTNANGIDLNRNFPSKDWEKNAIPAWKGGKDHGDSRKFPGKFAGSEREVKCLAKHIEQFTPDFVVSVHTPYGLLDLDGPQDIELPKIPFLSWKRLGTFPGSLGRYLWVDRQVPVMTVELKDEKILEYFNQLDLLQDTSGNLAIKLTGGSAPL